MKRDLAERFHTFAARECVGISPLYAALAEGVAEDPDLLALASAARPGQPAPNMLLASVHFLLRRDEGARLAEFYPSLGGRRPVDPPATLPLFREFCLERDAPIRSLLARRSVSTNEPARCCALVLGFRAAAQALGSEAMHFLEIGASAGLNLLWDRYAYDYGSGRKLGPTAALRLGSELRGGLVPDLGGANPLALSRVGIDPAPLDPSSPDDRDWLLALVWPELVRRQARLEQALDLAKGSDLDLRSGDGIELFPDFAAALPSGAPLCVYHSFTFNQIDETGKTAFESALVEASRERPVARVSLEWAEASAPVLELSRYHNRVRDTRRLALCDAHGAWIEWIG